MGLRQWLFTAKPDNLTGNACPACKEDSVAHNKTRNKTCSKQLGRPNFN